MDTNQKQENEEIEEKSTEQQLLENGKKMAEEAAKNAAKNTARTVATTVANAIAAAITSVISLIGLPAIAVILGVILVANIFLPIISEVTTISSKSNETLMSFVEVRADGPVVPSVDKMVKIIDQKLKEIGIDKKDLYLGNEKQSNVYLFKFMMTSLATQLPLVKNNGAISLRDILDHNWDELLALDKLAVQGIVKIKRCEEDDKNKKELEFCAPDVFDEMIQNNDKEALNYFSLTQNLQLRIATYTKVTVTTSESTSGVDTNSGGSDTDNNNSDGNNSGSGGNKNEDKSETIEITEQPVPYQSIISPYSIPFDLLMVLQEMSQNPEYVSTFADLIQDGEIELTIFDSIETLTEDYTYTYNLNQKWLQQVPVETPKETEEENSQEEGNEEKTPEMTTQLNSSTSQVTKKTKTITETDSVSAKVTKADVWVFHTEKEYEKKKSDPEYPLKEDGITNSIENENEPPDPTQVGGSVSWKTGQTENTIETLVTEEWNEISNKHSIDEKAVNKFLGLWKNKTGTYKRGEDEEYVSNGELVKYDIPNSKRKEPPITNILSAEEMLIGLLSNSETTQSHAHIMKYLIHFYKTGEKLEINLDFLDTESFTEIDYVSSNSLKDYIHYWENGTTEPPQTKDGKYYIVFDDGFGNPTVGWGIYITAHASRLKSRGVDVSGLTVGAEVDKSIVDSIEDEVINDMRKSVISITSGLDLEDYQIDALTSRCFNCGVGGGMSGFVQAYKTYGNTDALYDNLLNKPVTSNGVLAPGLVTRRKAEWRLFHEGYNVITKSKYVSTNGSSEMGQKIIQKAKECHDYLRTHGYRYEMAGISIPIKSNVHTVDCSSYVSWVLYEVGFSEFAGYQKTSSVFLDNPWGWEKIKNTEDLQPGDILCYSGHVQIYAGDGKIFNCGGNESIQAEAPHTKGHSINSMEFALRPPNK